MSARHRRPATPWQVRAVVAVLVALGAVGAPWAWGVSVDLGEALAVREAARR